MKLLTTTEAAARLGIKRRRVLALIETGRLRAQRLGVAAWMIPESALAAVELRKPGRPPKTAKRKAPPDEPITLGRTIRTEESRESRAPHTKGGKPR